MPPDTHPDQVPPLVHDTLEALLAKGTPYHLTVYKNLNDTLHVYQIASTNLDTVLEDSINKLNSPPPEPPPAWWKKITGTT